MGDWVYYITFMSLETVASRVSVVDDIHITRSLKEQLQRALTSNARSIAQYLQSQQQRFFNAIVVGTYGGSPRWHEVEISDGRQIPSTLKGALGFLELRGTEILFAIDGQHRVKGIQLALEENRGLGNEEVCAIFVKGVTASKRSNDAVGFERTRRLFSTLNRYAKPVRKRDIIALDEDDVIAIVARRLLEEYRLFENRIAMDATKNISPNDGTNFTSLVALYDALDVCLQDRKQKWKAYKQLRPPESEVNEFYDEGVHFWDTMCRHFKVLRDFRRSRQKNPARPFRHSNGGNVLFRPIGLLMVARVIADFEWLDMSRTRAIGRVARVPMVLSRKPWVGLLWDKVNRRMLTAPENQKLARRLLYYGAGGQLSDIGTSERRLVDELAGVLHVAPSAVRLRRYARPARASS